MSDNSKPVATIPKNKQRRDECPTGTLSSGVFRKQWPQGYRHPAQQITTYSDGNIQTDTNLLWFPWSNILEDTFCEWINLLCFIMTPFKNASVPFTRAWCVTARGEQQTAAVKMDEGAVSSPHARDTIYRNHFFYHWNLSNLFRLVYACFDASGNKTTKSSGSPSLLEPRHRLSSDNVPWN